MDASDWILATTYLGFWVWMLVDCSLNESEANLVGWFLTIAIVPGLGPLVYLFGRKIVRPRRVRRVAPAPIEKKSVVVSTTFEAWNPNEPRPWRRLWARFLDFQILGGIPASLLAPIWLYFFPHFAGIAGLGIACAGANEPLCLVYCGNTPGKWLLGILLQKSDGNRLSQKEASRRFWAVAWRSIIPVFPFCAALAYRDLKKRGATKWDRKGGYIVTYRPISRDRWLTSMSLVVIFIAGYWVAFSQILALHQQ